MSASVVHVVGFTVVGVTMASISATASFSVWRDRLVLRRVRALRGSAAESPLARLVANPAVDACSRFVSQRSAERRARHGLVELVDRVVRGLRSGRTPVAAVRDASAGLPIADGLAGALAEGRGLADAAELWAGQRPIEGVELVALALTLAGRVGGSTAAVLDGVAGSLRDRLSIEREVVALSSQARASMAVLVAAPVGALALASAVDRHLLHIVLGTPVGWACLVLGSGLDLIGALWMRRMVRMVSR